MVSKISVLRTVEATLQLVQTRLATFPSHGIYLHALTQLEGMHKVLSKNQNLEDFVGSVDIGLMAAREIEPNDPELADALMMADFQFKKLAKNG